MSKKLIITENPTTAKCIIDALGGISDIYHIYNIHRHAYYVNDEYLVSWAITPLFELAPTQAPEIEATEEFFLSTPMTDGFCPDIFSFVNIESEYHQPTYMNQSCFLNNLLYSDPLDPVPDYDEVIHAGSPTPAGEILIRIILHEAKCSLPVSRLVCADFSPDSVSVAFDARSPLSEYDTLARIGYLNMYRNHLMGKDSALQNFNKNKDTSYSSDDEWNENFLLFCEFLHKFGRIPSGRETYMGVDINRWQLLQMKIFQNGLLSAEREQKLRGVRFAFYGDDFEWQTNYELCEEFLREYNRLPKFNDADYKGVSLFRWAVVQEMAYCSGKLPTEREQKLLKLGFIFTCRSSSSWQYHFEQYKKFKQDYGREPQSGEIYNKKDLYNWAEKQRSAFKKGTLLKEHRKKLREIGFVLE